MSRVTINPGSIFDASTGYYILLDADFVESTDTNHIGNQAITDPATFTFNTNAVPSIISSTPIDDATGIISTAFISITASIDVTANTGNLYLHKTSDNSLVETFNITAVSIAGDTITFTPTNPFEAGTEYYVLADSGIVRDSDLFEFPGISSTTELSFTTDASPLLSSFTPTINSTDTNRTPTVTLTFDQNVQADTGNITVYELGGGVHETIDINSVSFSNNVVEFTTTLLDPLTTYYITIDNTAIEDVDSGFHFGGISTDNVIKFTTMDAPVLSTITSSLVHLPNVDYAFDIEIQASENIFKNVGNINIYDNDTSDVIGQIDMTNVLVTIVNDILKIRIKLPESTNCRIALPAYAVANASSSGNLATNLYFTTEEVLNYASWTNQYSSTQGAGIVIAPDVVVEYQHPDLTWHLTPDPYTGSTSIRWYGGNDNLQAVRFYQGNITSINIPQFKSKSLTQLCAGSSLLQSAVITADLSNVDWMSVTFINCISLTHVTLPDTSNIVDFWRTFVGCSALNCINRLDTTGAVQKTEIFKDCYSLVQPTSGVIADLEDANGANWVNANLCP